MSSIERQITVTRGPFFFEQDGDLMFQFACDNSTIVGPMLARPSHIAEYPEAHAAFKSAQAAGVIIEPEFITREVPDKEAARGLSVFDMTNGVAENAPHTDAINVGAGNRKAGPTEARRGPGRPRKEAAG